MKEEKINRIIQLIKSDLPQENHLFKILSKTDNPFPLLKPLKDVGYFDPKKNPHPIEVENQKGSYKIPQWNVLDYLVNAAKKNNSSPTDEITELLINIINDIIEYKTETNERIENYITDWEIAKIIFLLPAEFIQDKHIEFIRIALNSKWGSDMISHEIVNSIIPNVIKLNAKEILIKLLNIVFDYKVLNNDRIDKYESLVDNYSFNKLMRLHKSSILKICGNEATEIVLKKIQQICGDDEFQFNSIWIPTIEDHPQTSFPEKYECQLVYFVRDFYQTSQPEDISNDISTLIHLEHPIFIRLAVHIINYHYQILNFIFWELENNPLEIVEAKHELFEFFKNNCIFFSVKQIDRIIQMIEEKEYFLYDEFKNDKEKADIIIASLKKEWLSALLKTNNEKIVSLFNKYNSINPSKIEHPGFNSWSESSWGYKSPIKDTDLLTKSIEEIVEYLNNFEEKDRWEEPSIDGLSETLRICVSENPNKFSDGISSFLAVKQIFQHSLLWGFSEALKSEKTIDWQSIIKFIKELINAKSFWVEDYTENLYNYRNWIISQIADLINFGTSNDAHAFEPSLLPDAEYILLLLIDNAESNYNEMQDVINSVLNSNKGKIYTAMINYSLRYARLFKKDDENKWINSIKELFNKNLDKNIEPSIDFSVVVGEYLPNLYYLDKEWVTSNINILFPEDDNKYWEPAFTGYLYYTSSVYSHLYKLLSENGHYLKALQIDFKDEHANERVAQHICVAYLEGWEDIDDTNSLIYELINSSNIKHLSALINFFWMQRDSITEKIKNKVKPLWKQLFFRFKNENENKEYFKVIAESSKFIYLADEIDEDIFTWLKFAARHINNNFHYPFFIEQLLKHVDNTPKAVGDLFIEMLNNGFFPEYKIEYIIEIISKININNFGELAVKICNLYLLNGVEFVRPIYDIIIKESKK
ncbi:MAG: hypothetical protein A2X64_08845 [Ignavibacteria bacterium GWF2_33_9]|nr:MAG: hypothetical protein A2X64_08845 [Ignavibacteria bacterium GWF2_33_9]